MLFGNGLYGTDLFAGGEDTTPPDPGASQVDLMAYLPVYLHGVKEFQEIMETEGQELEQLSAETDTLLAQFFVDTATWGLSNWESEMGLTIDPSKPKARRREQIRAKLRGKGTTTRVMIVNVAAAFSGGEVVVIEYPEENRFVVKFIGVLGIPPNMAGFISMLEQIKPAHLTYSIAYTYTAWQDLAGMLWSDAGNRTWAELRTYEGA